MGWHQVNRQEVFLNGGQRGDGNDITNRSSAIVDRSQGPISLAPDFLGLGSGSLLDLILSSLLKK